MPTILDKVAETACQNFNILTNKSKLKKETRKVKSSGQPRITEMEKI